VRSDVGNESAVFRAHPDSWIIYKSIAKGVEQTQVAKVKDLNDQALLLALSVVEIRDFAHGK
jgi:hypothetical protein